MNERARLVFRVEAMDCAHEVAILRGALEGVAGVESLQFDTLARRMTIAGDAATLRREAVVEAVARTGMKAEPWREVEGARGMEAVATGLSGVALLGGFAARWAGSGGVVFFAVAVAAGLWQVLPRAVAAARRLRPDMNLLMTVAVAGAIGIGEWSEAGSVAFLFSLSLALEAWSVGRARRAVEALLRLAPATATLLDGGERRVAADQVAPGSRILVRPNERIPLDGVVVAGRSAADQSAITGESMPVEKSPGDTVYAGTINGSGAIEVRTTSEAGETTVAHIARMVEAAGARRSRSERWAERFAAVYTPVVLGLAVVLCLAPPLLFGGAWGDWFYRSLVLLVIACPCALVISTPVAIVAGLTAAARHGVLVKSGEHLETPSRIRAFAFDKTGTLTLGRPRIVEVVPLQGHTEEELLARAAAVEARSDHPLARAIVAAATARGIPAAAATSVVDHHGRGAEGVVEGRRFWVGSRRWIEERHAETAEVSARIDALSGPGRSVVAVGSENHVCGYFAVADAIREGARAGVDALRREGVRHIVMVTGDNHATAEAIAAEIGVDETRAELLPDQKVAAVEEIAARHGAVAMVGDGINDAPAMARSDLGIAMGAVASDAALETADVALMTNDLSRLPWLIRHSRRTLTIIRENIAASLAVKAAFVALTLAGPASLWTAIAADMGVSLAVIANALRLLR